MRLCRRFGASVVVDSDGLDRIIDRSLAKSQSAGLPDNTGPVHRSLRTSHSGRAAAPNWLMRRAPLEQISGGIYREFNVCNSDK
jgi:hypothetical protein